MTKFLKDHPAFLVTMFWAYMTWISLMWETAYLRSFGILPVDYGTLQDIITLAFRRPESLIFVIGGFAFIYIIPNAFKNIDDSQHRDFIRAFILIVIVLFQGFGVQYDAEFRASEIKKITPVTILDANLNYLVVANIHFKKEKTTPLINQVIVTKLGSNVVLYNPNTKLVSVIPMSEIESIEIAHFAKKGLKK